MELTRCHGTGSICTELQNGGIRVKSERECIDKAGGGEWRWGVLSIEATVQSGGELAQVMPKVMANTRHSDKALQLPNPANREVKRMPFISWCFRALTKKPGQANLTLSLWNRQKEGAAQDGHLQSGSGFWQVLF